MSYCPECAEYEDRISELNRRVVNARAELAARDATINEAGDIIGNLLRDYPAPTQLQVCRMNAARAFIAANAPKEGGTS